MANILSDKIIGFSFDSTFQPFGWEEPYGWGEPFGWSEERNSERHAPFRWQEALRVAGRPGANLTQNLTQIRLSDSSRQTLSWILGSIQSDCRCNMFKIRAFSRCCDSGMSQSATAQYSFQIGAVGKSIEIIASLNFTELTLKYFLH